MPTKRQKKAVIRQLLVPVLLIIAALLYQPVMGLLHPAEEIKDTTPDKNQLVVTYLDVGQGDATLISKGNFHMLIDAGKNERGATVVEYLKSQKIEK